MKAFILIALMAIFLFGCNNNDDLINGIGKEILALKTENESLRADLRAISSVVREQEKKVALLPASEVLFLPTSTEFQSLQSYVGPLVVSISDLTAYANGTRLKVTIGNPHQITITDVAFLIGWTGDSLSSNKDLKIKDVKFLQGLSAGSWNSEFITLEGVAPADLKFIEISDLKFSQIKLHTH